MSNSPKIPWRSVPMVAQDANGNPDPIPDYHPLRITALRQYRRDGEIDGVWLCTPEQFGDPNASELGPRVEQIDWTGFPEFIAAETD